jgi:ketosteroid isomerase-like protein
MARSNAEVIEVLFAALAESDLETVLGLIDADVEWSPTEGTYRGVTGVAEHFVEWMEPWDEHRIEAEEIVQSPDDRVLATIHLTARGETSGMRIDQRFFHVYTLRDGKVVRMIEFVDRAPAVEAAGLEGGSD